jgi:hypothetical protein
VEDRILLHLLKYRDFTYEYNVPFELTSAGIAKAVGTNRSYILRVIKYMSEKSYIEEYNGRMKNGKKIQRYFLLKENGREYSRGLKKILLNLSITMVFPDNTVKVLKLNKIISYLKKENICPNITPQTLYNFISYDGMIKINNVIDLTANEYVDQSTEAPKVQSFLGRNKEIAKLRKWMDEDKKRNIVFVCGMAGIGKSTLTAKLIDSYRGLKHIFWYNCHNLDSLHGILFKLAEFFSKAKQNELEKYIRSYNNYDYYEVSLIIIKLMERTNAILILDDFHESNDEIQNFFSHVFKRIPLLSKTKMIVLSRDNLYFDKIKNNFPEESKISLELHGLDFKDSRSILSEKEIDDNGINRIFKITFGNPKLLKIMSSDEDIEKYVHNEIFTKLEEHEKRNLEIMSIFLTPAQKDLLYRYDDFDSNSFYVLTKKHIIKKNAQNRYILQGIIKQFFYARLPQIKKRLYHKIAAECYEKSNDPMEQIKSLYHYSLSGGPKKSLPDSEIIDMISSNKNNPELLAVLEGINWKKINPLIMNQIDEIINERSMIENRRESAFSYRKSNSKTFL